MDNLFEIKIYLKTQKEDNEEEDEDDENDENIGSFLLDLSKLLSKESKITEKIYFSGNINLYFSENSKVKNPCMKMSANISLIKSESEKNEFLNFYKNTNELINSDFINLYELIKNQKIFEKENQKILRKKNLKKIKKRLINLLGKETFEFIDLNLISLFDEEGNFIFMKFLNFLKVFLLDFDLLSELLDDENLSFCGNLIKFGKLKIKKNLSNDIDKYLFNANELAKILKIKLKKELNININENENLYFNSNLNYENYNENENNINNLKKVKIPYLDILNFTKKVQFYLRKNLSLNFYFGENPYENNNYDNNNIRNSNNKEIIDVFDFIFLVYNLEKINQTIIFNRNNAIFDINNYNNLNLNKEESESITLNEEDNNNKEMKIDKDKNKNKNILDIYSIKFNIISAKHLIILEEALNSKPNPYFIFEYNKENFISNFENYTYNPSWNQIIEYDLKCPIDNISNDNNNKNTLNFLKEKIEENINIKFFSKKIQENQTLLENISYNLKDNYNINDINNNNNKDDYIGETNLSLKDILINNYYNNNFDGYFYILNKSDSIVGQIYLNIFFDRKFMEKFNEIRNQFYNNNNNSIYSNNINNKKNEIFDYKISTKNNLLVKGNYIGNNNNNNENLNLNLNSNLNKFELTKRFNFETNQFNSHFDETLLKKSEKIIQKNQINQNEKQGEGENYIFNKNNIYNFNNLNKNINLEEENSENLWNIIKENEVRNK
jgi:hypothetical protein